jgi:RNA polymerase sigma factor (sigma-70 family)
MSEVVERLRKAVLRGDTALTSGQLLECFVRCREDAAVAALVQRHGPMVWGVCRRVLSNYHDAEDAFQATFLVLVRKANTIMPREMVSNWLFGVARQTALKARAIATRRKAHEKQVKYVPEPGLSECDSANHAQAVVDCELAAIPDKYRAVLILCELEERSRKEVSGLLGIPEGTVAGRLARAKSLLVKRLTRRGVTTSFAFADILAKRAVPSAVTSAAVRAACERAGGSSAAQESMSLRVSNLATRVSRSMLMHKLWPALVLVFAVFACGTGALSLLAQDRKEPPDNQPKEGSPRDLTRKGGKEMSESASTSPDAIVWGDVQAGLKAGIGIRPGDRHFVRSGESATFVIYLQNATDKPITVSHTETLFDEFLPTVLDEKGVEQTTLIGPVKLGLVPIVKRSLEPREVIRLGFPWFVIRDPDWTEEAAGPTLLAGPGKYRVRYGRLGLRINADDHDVSLWSTGGGVELEIRREAGAPSP